MNALILKTIRMITKILEKSSSRLTSLWVSKLFFSPHIKRKKVLQLKDMTASWLDFTSTFGDSERCRVYESGSGPTVLLVHGWEGSAYSYSKLSEDLVRSGFKVILIDFPAHGQSTGTRTNLEDLKRLIEHLSTKEQHLQAIIGHSFGAFATSYAISLDLKVKHFISISSPTDMNFILDSLCETIGASEVSRNTLIAKIESILKGPYELASIKNNRALNSVDGLIIHDENDSLVPYEQATQLAEFWPKAELVTTNGLGHNRILKDDGVISKIINYLSPEQISQA